MAKERWEGNWILPRKSPRQPHKTKSRGIGGPGGPLRTSDARVAEHLERGLKSNPIPLGFVSDNPIPVSIRNQLERLWRIPTIRRQFSMLANCRECWVRGKRTPRAVNSRKRCLLHEYLKGEKLLGLVSTGNTYDTIQFKRSL